MDLKTKNKIPIWDNSSDYIPEAVDFVELLIEFSDPEYQERIWAREAGPERSDWYMSSLIFDDVIDIYRWKIKEKKEIKLSCEQLTAIFRAHKALEAYYQRTDWPEPKSSSRYDERMAMINDPNFEKARKKARFALSLLKK